LLFFNFPILAIPAILAISSGGFPITRDHPLLPRPYPAFSRPLLQTKALSKIGSWTALGRPKHGAWTELGPSKPKLHSADGSWISPNG
jgi:hypothetical protein